MRPIRERMTKPPGNPGCAVRPRPSTRAWRGWAWSRRSWCWSPPADLHAAAMGGGAHAVAPDAPDPRRGRRPTPPGPLTPAPATDGGGGALRSPRAKKSWSGPAERRQGRRWSPTRRPRRAAEGREIEVITPRRRRRRPPVGELTLTAATGARPAAAAVHRAHLHPAVRRRRRGAVPGPQPGAPGDRAGAAPVARPCTRWPRAGSFKPVEVTAQDELFRSLTASFNHLLAKLGEREEDLKRAMRELESARDAANAANVRRPSSWPT